MDVRFLLTLVAAVTVSDGFVVLKDGDYVQLNDENGGNTINSSTSNRLAFDNKHNILYVVAREPRRLTSFILDSDDGLTLLTENVFNADDEGYPLDVEVCNPQVTNGVARLAVSFEAPTGVSDEGVVKIYEPFSPIDMDLILIKTVTVGPEPVDMEFAQDCEILLVANRGSPSKVGNSYKDPEGTLSKISLPYNLHKDSIVDEVTISFTSVFSGQFATEDVQDLRAKNFRAYPLRQPDTTLLTIMQNIEPEKIVIDPTGRIAMVSLPKNNAIARVTLEFNQVSRIFPLGNRSWTDYHMDPSDQDTVVNLRGYNIFGLSQATEMRWLTVGSNDWIVTLDTGKTNYIPAYNNYADNARGKELLAKGDIMISDPVLEAQLADDSELGRLLVSSEDGKGNTGKIEHVFTFGGRGFGIRSAENFETSSVVVDSVQQQTERYFNNIFNTAYLDNSATPVSAKEATSPSLGPELTAFDMGEFEGKTVLFMGGGSSGILYVYMLSPDARCLQPYFHSVHRRGETLVPWQTAFNDGKMGDIGITDLMYIHTDDIRPVVVVASATSNSLSVYKVADEPFTSV